jgi:hypothetical protein
LTQDVFLVEFDEDVVKVLCVVYDGFGALAWDIAEIDLGEGLTVLGAENAGQSFNDVLLVAEEVGFDFFFFVDGYSIADALDDIEEESEAEGVEGQVAGSDGLGLDFVEFDCASEEDKLVAGGVVGPKEFEDLEAGFFAEKGVELYEVQVVFDELEDE